jgi:hypothetical protein
MTFSITKLYCRWTTSPTSTECKSTLWLKPCAWSVPKVASTNSSILNSSSVISSLLSKYKSRLTSHHHPIATLKSKHQVHVILLAFYYSPFHQLGQNQHSIVLEIVEDWIGDCKNARECTKILSHPRTKQYTRQEATLTLTMSILH